jgi:uncharacterized protein YggT (Ycf19 family)
MRLTPVPRSLSHVAFVSYVDFILNLAGLLLWLNWRVAKADPLDKRRPATLIGTLRRAVPGGAWSRWQLPAILAGILLLRAVAYWKFGPAVGWNGKLDLGPTVPIFRSNLFGHMILFSIFSFARTLGIFYLWLLLLSILSGPEPFHALVRMQLGLIGRWPRWSKFLLPLVVTALVWGLASWPFAWLHARPAMSLPHRMEEALVIGLGAYLPWKFAIGALLALHLLNNYIYLGRHPFWNYVDATARTFLRPMEKIPLRAGRVDFAPLAGIALVFLLAELAGRLLNFLYGRLSI